MKGRYICSNRAKNDNKPSSKKGGFVRNIVSCVIPRSSLKPFGAVFVPVIDMINLSINFNIALLDCTCVEERVIEPIRLRLV